MILAGEDTGKAGPLGLLVVVLLGIVCYFLFKSMSGHLRKVQHGFSDDVERTARPVSTGPSTPVDDEHRAASGTEFGGPNRPTPDNPSN